MHHRGSGPDFLVAEHAEQLEIAVRLGRWLRAEDDQPLVAVGGGEDLAVDRNRPDPRVRSSNGCARGPPSSGSRLAQVAIAWVGAQGDDIAPLVGARTRQKLAEALAADDVRPTDEQLAAIESAVPKGSAAGDRYDAHQLALLDSER